MDELIGRSFGGYELKELVGTGGMASIYKGYDQRLSRWVAIKVMEAKVSSSAEETLLARFRLEAQSIARLRHPNILTIYGYGEDDGWAYIIMEFVPGGSLEDRLTDKQYTALEALEIIIPVSEALAVAHKNNIIHRDIKPANILMSDNDWPLLADFGLAKVQQSNSPGLTMPGQVLGTMAYAAPEQIEEGQIDHRVDIYSIGVVFYEMLTNKLPFEGETSFDFLMARLTDPPIPITKANPDLPPLLEPFIQKMLAQAADERYQDMDEFIEALTELRQTLRSGVDTAAPPTEEPLAVHLFLALNQAEVWTSKNVEQSAIIGRGHSSAKPDIDVGPVGGAQAGVSRKHARLLKYSHDWLIEDLNSTNGTFVNGVRLAAYEPHEIKSGDSIRVGRLELILEIS